MEQTTLYPNAKINLGLFIKGKRPDGYHTLETVLYPLPDLKDELSIKENTIGECRIETTGIAIDSPTEDNLCYKAWKLLRERFPDLPGIDIHLIKNIPSGAGLGGGSSDAAFTMKGLREMFRLPVTDDGLAEIAAKLGADVPFFVYNQPLLAKGIGTEVSAIEIKLSHEIRLITPGIHSSTIAAYKALDYRQCGPHKPLSEVLTAPVSTWRMDLVNDLEKPVFEMYPQLADIKADLYDQGAVYAAMSGSGSAVFGLF